MTNVTGQDLIDVVNNDMLRIEFLEDVKDGSTQHIKGDIVSHQKGKYFQKLGWAKCAETGETGERVEGVSKIKPQNVKSSIA